MTATASEIQTCLRWLRSTYDVPKSFLQFETPFQLLVAVILSAQCTDARVNQTTPDLFRRFPDAKSLASGRRSEIEKLIHSCGFFRTKAKSIQGMAQALLDRFDGKVPATLEELVTLPGVGRKTASVILNQAFSLPAIAVDTHVKRVSRRLGWAKQSHPDKIELELKERIPKKNWIEINALLILHGRTTCLARKPRCEACGLKDYCDFYSNLKT